MITLKTGDEEGMQGIENISNIQAGVGFFSPGNDRKIPERSQKDVSLLLV